MDHLLANYTAACERLQVEPLHILVNGLKNAVQVNSVVAAIKLTGNSKVLFNERLDSTDVTAIAEALQDDANVHTLDFSYNRIDDEGVRALAALVRRNPNIASIILSNNRVTDDGLVALVDALAESRGSGLQQLVLNCNPGITDDGILRLSDFLRTHDTLTMLDIGYTGVGMKGLMGLFAATHEGACKATLESLKIDAPTFRGPSEHSTRHLGNVISACSALKELSLKVCQIQDHDLQYLMRTALPTGSGIVSLSLRSNQLSDVSGPTLAEMVKKLPCLEELDLAGNRLGDAAVVELCQAMIDMGDQCNIWRLDLQTCCINDLGLEAVSETLAQCPSLQYVRVWDNRFGPSSSQTLAEVLEQLAEEGRELDLDVRPYCVDGMWMVARL